MRILVLEDNRDRRGEMRRCLAERLVTYESLFFETPAPMLRYLREHVDDAACISLDHDMDLVEAADGRLVDPGTGREVADFLSTRPACCPVILHTTNTAAADGMQCVLKEAGWRVYRVSPWGDLEWVRSEWIRTVRRAIARGRRPGLT